jgi:hypothetical protein
MVLLGSKYWTETYPVHPLLSALFLNNGKEAAFKKNVLTTDDADAVVAFLLSFPPSEKKHVENLERFAAPRHHLRRR